jgi:Mg2+-importing ATPase
MITFGLVSSVFDFLTFGMLALLAVPVAHLRSAWFVESLLTEVFVLVVIRTFRPFFRSAPSRPLLAASIGVAVLALLLPYLPGRELMGFAPLPPELPGAVVVITLTLMLACEATKRVFFRRHSPAPGG